MSQTTIQELVVLFSGGIGLMLLGCLVIPFAGGWSRRARISATLAVLIASAVIPVVFEYPWLGLLAPSLVAAIVSVVLLTGSPIAIHLLRRAALVCRHRTTRGGLVAVAGHSRVGITGEGHQETPSGGDIVETNPPRPIEANGERGAGTGAAKRFNTSSVYRWPL